MLVTFKTNFHLSGTNAIQAKGRLDYGGSTISVQDFVRRILKSARIADPGPVAAYQQHSADRRFRVRNCERSARRAYPIAFMSVA